MALAHYQKYVHITLTSTVKLSFSFCHQTVLLTANSKIKTTIKPENKSRSFSQEFLEPKSNGVSQLDCENRVQTTDSAVESQ